MKFLKSIYFTGILIIYLIVFFILGSVIPQHQTSDYYEKNYNVIESYAISFFGLNDYSHSLFLIIPSLLFFANLTYCSAERLIRRIKNKSSLRPGPDIIHLGILILIIGSFISANGKIEEMFYLGKGEKLDILSDYKLVVDDFIFEKYESGKPKKFASEVSIMKNGSLFKKKSIEVNKPLMIEKYAIYQQSYSAYQELTIADNSGHQYVFMPNQKIYPLKIRYVFVKYDNAGVYFSYPGKVLGGKVFHIGDDLEGFTIKNVSEKYLSGLKVVYDPGAIVVLISFLIISIGLTVTAIQKTGELEI